MEFDKPRFKQLVHYVVSRVGEHDWFGAIKLNKVLWFAEARTYMLTGMPITGETYTRGQFGPVPHHMIPVQHEMVREGVLQITKGKRQTSFKALTPAQDNWFSAAELQTINWWADHIDQKHTAGSISDKSHDYAWEIAKMGEELPLYVYRVARIQEPSEHDLNRLSNRAKELGLV
jgi:hypothetical protein